MASQLPYHTRSTSLPPRSHPIAQQFEEQLQEVRAWLEEARRPPLSDNGTALADGVRRLAKLHSCVGEILKMPQAQSEVGRSKHEGWMAEELDGSVRLLDMCCSARDSYSLVKQRAVELQSTIRRRRGCDDAATERKLQDCAGSMREMGKEVDRSLKELKQMGERGTKTMYPQQDDGGALLAIRALREVRQLTVTVCDSVFSGLASKTPRRPKTASGYWSLVSKAMSSSKHDKATSWSYDLISLCKRISGEGVDAVEAQRRLKEMESKVSEVEDGLECLFQALVRNRVTLLNAVSL